MAERAAVEIEHLGRSFDGVRALDDVTLRIPEGRTTAIIGPSGAGKSVLLKHIVGLLRPDEGTVRVLGVDLGRAGERELYAVRRRMGMLFQDGALFDSMTVAENVAFPLVHHAPQLDEDARRARVEEVLGLVGMNGFEDRSPASLSGGQRKRVGLARAIVLEPEILLLDEPNSGLDPINSDAIDELIREMKRRLGITFVVVSHDIVGTVRVADHVAMLDRGRLVARAPTAEFVRLEDPVVRRFLRRNLALPGEDGVVALPPAAG